MKGIAAATTSVKEVTRGSLKREAPMGDKATSRRLAATFIASASQKTWPASCWKLSRRWIRTLARLNAQNVETTLVIDKVSATTPMSSGNKNQASAIWLPRVTHLLRTENRIVQMAPRAACVPTAGAGRALPAATGEAVAAGFMPWFF